MQMFEQQKQEETAAAIIRSIEESSKKEVFSFATLSNNLDGLELVITFTDKSMMLATLAIENDEKGHLFARVKGKYL